VSVIGFIMILAVFVSLPAILFMGIVDAVETEKQVKNIAKTLSSHVSEDGYCIESEQRYIDVWGNLIEVEYVGDSGRKTALIVTSYGEDGKLGTVDDIVEVDCSVL